MRSDKQTIFPLQSKRLFSTHQIQQVSFLQWKIWMISHKFLAICNYVWVLILNKNVPLFFCFCVYVCYKRADVDPEVLPSKTSLKLPGKSYDTVMCFHIQTFVEHTPAASSKVFSLITELLMKNIIKKNLPHPAVCQLSAGIVYAFLCSCILLSVTGHPNVCPIYRCL